MRNLTNFWSSDKDITQDVRNNCDSIGLPDGSINQIERQTAPSSAVRIFTTDSCCLRNEHTILVFFFVVNVQPHYLASSFVSGGPVSSARGQPGVGIALSMRAERAVLKWIPVKIRSCAVRLDGFVRINSNRSVRHSRRRPRTATHLRSKRNSIGTYPDYIVVVADDLNAQLDDLVETAREVCGPVSVPPDCADSSDRLIQVYFHHRMILVNTSFATKDNIS